MSVVSRPLLTTIAGLAVLLLACSDDEPTSPGGGSGSRDGTVPYLIIGGAENEMGYAARRTPDGEYLIVGTTERPARFFDDLYVVRTDGDGAILGQDTLQQSDAHATVYASVLTADGGIVAITSRGDQAILIKFASDGSVAWEQNHGSYAGAAWYSLCSAGDGFLITIVPDVFADLNTVELILTNPDGTLKSNDEWTDSPLRIFSAAEAEDGSFLLAGGQRTTPTNFDIFIARTNPGSFTEDWAKIMGGQDGDHAMHVVALGNDAVLFGSMDDPPTPLDTGRKYLMRLLPDGQKEWTRDISSLGYVYDMVPTSDGGLAVVLECPDGTAKIARLRGSGTVVWERGLVGNSQSEGLHSIASAAGGFVATGFIQPEESSDTDIILVRTDLNGNGLAFPSKSAE